MADRKVASQYLLDRIQLNVNIDAATRKSIRDLMRATGRCRSDLVREALAQFIAVNLPKARKAAGGGR